MSSGGRRKLVESEKTQSMVMNIWKQKELLRREQKVLDTNRDLVVGHITLNQRITYTRFKQRLQHSRIIHAKIMGNKEEEQELRSKSRKSSYNTNYGMDPGDEEVLQKIWQSSRRKPSLAARASFSAPPGARPRTGSVVSGKVLEDGVSSEASRPSTSPAGQYHYLATGQKPRHPPQETLPKTQQQKTEQTETAKPRARFAKVTGRDGEVKDKLQLRRKSRAASFSTRPVSAPGEPTANIFQDGDHKTSLLDLHKLRVSSAGFETRVQNICARMKDLNMDDKYLIPDYYKYCRDKESAPHWKAGFGSNQYNQECTEEMEKSLGNPNIRSLTVKMLEV